MRQLKLRPLLPALALAAAGLLASWIAVHAAAPWMVLAAPLLLALALLATELWQSHRQGLPLRPSQGVLMLAASLVVAALIVGLGDPKQVRELMPVLTAVSAVAIGTGQRRRCLRLRA